MTEPSDMSRRQALMYGGLAAAVPLLPAMLPAQTKSMMPLQSAGAGGNPHGRPATQDNGDATDTWNPHGLPAQRDVIAPITILLLNGQ